jgi:hypothetical protein
MPIKVSVEEEEVSDEDMEALADIVASEVVGADLGGDDGGEDGGEDGGGGEDEDEDPNEFVHVDEKFYYLVKILPTVPM